MHDESKVTEQATATSSATETTGEGAPFPPNGGELPTVPAGELLSPGSRCRRSSDGKQGVLVHRYTDGRTTAAVRWAGEVYPEEVELELLEHVEGFSIAAAQYPRLEAATTLERLAKDLEEVTGRVELLVGELEPLEVLKHSAELVELRDLVVTLGDLVIVASVAARAARGAK